MVQKNFPGSVDLGKIIAVFMYLQGVTGRELAADLGMQESEISKILRSDRQIKIEEYARFERALDLRKGTFWKIRHSILSSTDEWEMHFAMLCQAVEYFTR